MPYSPYLLPVKETIRSAWDKLYGAKTTFWIAIVISFLIAFGIGLLAGITSSFSDFLTGLINLISQLVSMLISMGLLYIGIQRAKNAPINFKQMFYAFNFPIALRIIGVYAIQFLIFFPLTLLFILIPMIIFGTAMGDAISSGLTLPKVGFIIWGLIGFIITVYLTLRMVLSMGFVLETGVNSWQAIKMSFTVTKHNEWRLLLILIFQIAALIIGAIPLGIGLIWTLPLTLIIYGEVYQRLRVNLNQTGQ